MILKLPSQIIVNNFIYLELFLISDQIFYNKLKIHTYFSYTE